MPNYAQLDLDDEEEEAAGEGSSLLRKASLVSVDGMQVVANASAGRGYRKCVLQCHLRCLEKQASFMIYELQVLSMFTITG